MPNYLRLQRYTTLLSSFQFPFQLPSIRHQLPLVDSPHAALRPDAPKGRAPPAPTSATVDLPPLSSLVPKLEHLGTSRPRRMKTKAMTRPTMTLNNGVGELEDGITEETDYDLFGSMRGPVVPVTAARVEKKLEHRYLIINVK